MDTGKDGTPDRPEHHRLYRIRTDAEQIPNYIYFSCQNRRAQANLSSTSAFGHPKRKRFRDVCPIYDCIYLFHSSSSVSPQAVLLRECSGLGNPHKNVSPHRSRVRSTHCTCHSGLVFPAAVRGFQLLFFIIPFLYCVRSVSPAFRPSFFARIPETAVSEPSGTAVWFILRLGQHTIRHKALSASRTQSDWL